MVKISSLATTKTRTRWLPLFVVLLVLTAAFVLTTTDEATLSHSSSLALLQLAQEKEQPQSLPDKSQTTKDNSNKLPSAYSCSEAQNQGINGMKFFSHQETCAGRMVPFTLPSEGFIFGSRYFTKIDETRVRDVFHQVLAAKTADEIAQGIVLDIGGNSGWYTTYAATCFGTRVHVFEPQSGCLDILCPAVAQNHVQHLVTIHHNIVAATPQTIALPQGCDPGFRPQTNQDAASSNNNNNNKIQQISSVSIPNIVQDDNQPVLFIKIDVEGTEMGVLQSLEPLLQRNQVHDVVVEVKAKAWESDALGWDVNTREFIRLVYENGFAVYSLERKVYIEKGKFVTWLKTTGYRGDNNFWLQKQK